MEEIKSKPSGFIVAIRIEDRELSIKTDSAGKALNLTNTIVTGATECDNPDYEVSLRYEKG